MSVISQTYSIIIDRGMSEPGHGKEVVDGDLPANSGTYSNNHPLPALTHVGRQRPSHVGSTRIDSAHEK